MNAVLGGTLVIGAVFVTLNLLSDVLYRAARSEDALTMASRIALRPVRPAWRDWLAARRNAGIAPAGAARPRLSQLARASRAIRSRSSGSSIVVRADPVRDLRRPARAAFDPSSAATCAPSACCRRSGDILARHRRPGARHLLAHRLRLAHHALHRRARRRSSRRRSASSIGTIAGYLGGWVDTVLMRLTDIFLAFPRLVLALAFVAALGPGIENAVIAIARHRLAALCAASRAPRR